MVGDAGKQLLPIRRVEPEERYAKGKSPISNWRKGQRLPEGAAHFVSLESVPAVMEGPMLRGIMPTVLLPYTFPAFQVGSALPLQLQDQPECACMVARSLLYAALLPIGCILLSLLSCLHWCTTHFFNCYFWFGARYPGTWTSSSSAACPAHDVPPLRRCLRPFQTLCRQFLFLLCVVLHTGTCARTGSGEREVTAIVGRGSAPSNVQTLHDTGRLPTAAAEQGSHPPQKSSSQSYWSSCPEPGSLHSLQETSMHL